MYIVFLALCRLGASSNRGQITTGLLYGYREEIHGTPQSQHQSTTKQINYGISLLLDSHNIKKVGFTHICPKMLSIH